MLQLTFGNWSAAEKAFRASLVIDPLDADMHLNLGIALFGADRYEEAAEEHRRTIEIRPATGTAYYLLAGDLLALGQQETALEALKKESLEGYRLGGLICVYHRLGQGQDSDSVLAQLTSESAAHPAYEMAIACACRGDREGAFRWLGQSLTQREDDLAGIKADWAFAGIRDDARYAAVLEKMNLPH